MSEITPEYPHVRYSLINPITETVVESAIFHIPDIDNLMETFNEQKPETAILKFLMDIFAKAITGNNIFPVPKNIKNTRFTFVPASILKDCLFEVELFTEEQAKALVEEEDQ